MATNLQMSNDLFSLVTYSYQSGQAILDNRSNKFRKQNGQFLTPAPVARFMARQLGPICSGDRILDPAIGSGVLICALIEKLIEEKQTCEIWLDGYEIDPALCQVAREVLEQAARRAAKHDIILHVSIYEEDFILKNKSTFQPYLLLAEKSNQIDLTTTYNHIIANPPYFKLNSNDPRVKAVAGQVKGHTNIYTLFLALALKSLVPQGKACFIVPRSFCSGVYFASFRQNFINDALPLSIHLFDSRQNTFQDAAVLQENIIFTFSRYSRTSKLENSPRYVDISTSKDIHDLKNSSFGRQITLEQFLGKRHGTLFFRLPTNELDEEIVNTVDKWAGSLKQYGLEVSTGPVVAFRAKNWLTNNDAVAQKQAVPLLWMHNVTRQNIKWPVTNGNKPQGISLSSDARSLLVPVTNYVLLRRFSAKEEPRRLIAAPFLAEQFDYQWVGLENHLNYIYKRRGALEPVEVLGLSAFFNSAIIDRYFRIVNGNTQVNATELRALPLPPLKLIKQIGLEISQKNKADDLEPIVFSILREAGYLSPDFPLIRETRITMGKIQEAQEVLKLLELPPNQQNEISALTLLVLAQLSEETPWQEAKRQSLRIHDILLAIKEYYGREYAENTRETIRRQVIHQFIQAGLVIRNPDNPALPTNSPRTHYALSDAAVRTLQTYQSEVWEQAAQTFITSKGALLEVYQKSREQYKVPLRLATGEEYQLSPGQHNELQAAIVEEFGPRFAPGAKLLYLGDTANKTLILDKAGFEELGIPVPSHDKLPDVVLHDESRGWLFLIEAVISHGPVTPKRHFELEEILKDCSAGRVYVSAFPDFATFKSFLSDIAWETEVWLAEIPEHLIHFNGDRFLGPRNL